MPTQEASSQSPVNPNLVTIPVLLAFAVFSYINFVGFAPTLKHITQVTGNAVMGIRTNIYNIPFPLESEKIGSTQSQNAELITLSSKQSTAKIQQFYKNTMLLNGWVVEAESSKPGVHTTKYKREKGFVTITTSGQQGTAETIITVEITKN